MTLDVTLAGWAATIGLIAALFVLDLFVSRPGHAHTVGFREAVIASVFYVGVAIAFGVGFGLIAGWDFGTQYFAGYIVAKSLSVDNLFVFVVIMTTFAVPPEYQQRVLTFGILVALVLRAIFIALGAVLISTFSFMFAVFGLLLVFTAVQLFRHRDEDPDVEDNAIVRAARRVMPLTDDYAGGRMITRIDGRRTATPLFIVFVAISSTDVLFALDSIPAVFGVTEEPFIAFAANAFALLGLRALYFLVTGLLDPAGVSVDRPVADPRVHRHQTPAALRASAGRLDTGGADVDVADRDRGDPRDHDRRLAGQGAARSGGEGARRIAARDPRP